MKINTVNQDKIRNIENELFNTEYFNEESTVFPNKVFKKKFDKYYFLDTEDWFSSEPEFKKIIEFVKENGEQEFYNTIPGFNNIAGIEIPVQIDYKSYVLEQTFENKDNNIHRGIGLRMSPEMFYFDASKKWAIVFALTNNIFIVGVEKELSEFFEKIFKGQFKNIKEYVEFLENSNGSIINNKDEILNNYS